MERFGGLRAGLVLEADPSDAMPVAGHEEKAVAGGLVEVHRFKEVARHALVFEEGGAADEDALTVDEGADAFAGGLLEVDHLGQRHTGLLGQGRDGTGRGVVGKLLGAGGTPQQFGRSDPVEGVEAADGQTTGGQRAGLVEDEGRDARGGLEVTDVLDEDAQTGGSAQGGDHRGRRGQDERARAGHDQDGNDPVEVLGEAPDQSGDDQHQRGVVAHVLVDDPHEGQLGLLGGQDQVADSAQGGVFTGLAHLDLEEAVHVDGARKDRFAHAFVHRERFAGDVGLIDGTLSGDDLAVGGDVVAGADADDVSDLEFADGHFDFVAAGQAAGLGRGQFDE